jgi:3-dehydroquinate synthase
MTNVSALFSIQSQKFSVELNTSLMHEFTVNSTPRPYQVKIDSSNSFSSLKKEIENSPHPIFLVDKYVFHKILNADLPSSIPRYEIEAKEANKNIETVLEICEFLEKNNANRGSTLYVIGGGIVQDLGAFAASMFKRGIPWVFIPTTLLSQADSCVGGKTAVNLNGTKNLLGLFSAPRKVLVNLKFLATLENGDYLSGLGEIFRLCITGGNQGVECFERLLEPFLTRDPEAIFELIATSLLIKKAIVEHDEFEIDIRRSMNFGHSIGHAIEGLSNYLVPHGIGVAIGILVENRLSSARGLLSTTEEQRLLSLGKRIISVEILEFCKTLPESGLLKYLKNDKKAESSVLKLAIIRSIGQMIFADLPLNSIGEEEAHKATVQTLVLLKQ